MVWIHEDVNLDYFTENGASGGSGGTKFTFVKDLKSGAVMKSIEAWKQDWRLRGVRVWMTDGSSYLAGEAAGSHSEFELKENERITRLNVQPSGEVSSLGHHHRMGAIVIHTNLGRHWGIYSDGLQGNEHWVKVGSGLCCGIFGREGADLDQLGVAMLHSVTSATLDDIKYPNLDQQTVAKTPTFIVRENFDNTDGSLEQEFDLTMTKTVTSTKSWSNAWSVSFGQGVTVSAGLPEVVTVEGTLQWSVGYKSNHTVSKEEEKELKYEWPVKVPPGTKVTAEAKLFADQLTIPFTGTMKLMLENGKTYSYPLKGTYDGANYTRIDVKITEHN